MDSWKYGESQNILICWSSWSEPLTVVGRRAGLSMLDACQIFECLWQLVQFGAILKDRYLLSPFQSIPLLTSCWIQRKKKWPWSSSITGETHTWRLRLLFTPRNYESFQISNKFFRVIICWIEIINSKDLGFNLRSKVEKIIWNQKLGKRSLLLKSKKNICYSSDSNRV